MRIWANGQTYVRPSYILVIIMDDCLIGFTGKVDNKVLDLDVRAVQSLRREGKVRQLNIVDLLVFR